MDIVCLRGAPSNRVVTYNVLSDSLDDPDHYVHSDPADLDEDTRFARVVATLEKQMAHGAVIVCKR